MGVPSRGGAGYGTVRRYGTHDIRVAPGGLDLEGLTAFFEPGAPLPTLVVFELGLFVTPDKSGTSLGGQGRGGSGEVQGSSVRGCETQHTGVGRFRSFQRRSHQRLARTSMRVMMGTTAATRGSDMLMVMLIGGTVGGGRWRRGRKWKEEERVGVIV